MFAYDFIVAIVQFNSGKFYIFTITNEIRTISMDKFSIRLVNYYVCMKNMLATPCLAAAVVMVSLATSHYHWLT